MRIFLHYNQPNLVYVCSLFIPSNSKKQIKICLWFSAFVNPQICLHTQVVLTDMNQGQPIYLVIAILVTINWQVQVDHLRVHKRFKFLFQNFQNSAQLTFLQPDTYFYLLTQNRLTNTEALYSGQRYQLHPFMSCKLCFTVYFAVKVS